MSTTIIVIISIAAFIIAVGFLMLVFNLIPAIQQLRIFLADAEKTSVQIRRVSEDIELMSRDVRHKLDKADEVLENSKAITGQTVTTLKFLNKNLFGRYTGLLAMVPAIKFGWKLIKKFKGDK